MAWYDQVVHPDCPSEPQLTTAGPNVATCAGTHPEPLQAENLNHGVRCSSRERALHAPHPEPCSEHNWGLPVPGGDADVAPESPVDELSEKHKLILIKRDGDDRNRKKDRNGGSACEFLRPAQRRPGALLCIAPHFLTPSSHGVS